MSEDLKVYDIYVKYAEMTMDDGEVLVYEAYSPFPKGHEIDAKLVKLSLKDAINKINAMDDKDGLRMDYHGNTAYKPSTVMKVRWSKDNNPAKGVYLIDVTKSEVKYKLNDIVDAGNNSYKCVKIIDWMSAFGVKFLYCTKEAEVKKVVAKKVEPVEKVDTKDKTE